MVGRERSRVKRERGREKAVDLVMKMKEGKKKEQQRRYEKEKTTNKKVERSCRSLTMHGDACLLIQRRPRKVIPKETNATPSKNIDKHTYIDTQIDR